MIPVAPRLPRPTTPAWVRGWMRAAVLLLCAVALPPPTAEPQEAQGGDLRYRVTELAQSVDLVRGNERFLTVTLEISGMDPVRLRRVQPSRDDFQLVAGKDLSPCRWLRGGSVPEDPKKLRFVLGFSVPPRGVGRVTLRASVPRVESEQPLELKLAGLALDSPPHERAGSGWRVEIRQFSAQAYETPALPSDAAFTIKMGPTDVRIFRKENAGEEPARAILLSIHARGADLYDPTLDVSGTLLVEGGAAVPLLSASLRRTPSRVVKDPPFPPYVTGTFYFRLPPKGKVTGALIRLHRGAAPPRRSVVEIPRLPVPGLK